MSGVTPLNGSALEAVRYAFVAALADLSETPWAASWYANLCGYAARQGHPWTTLAELCGGWPAPTFDVAADVTWWPTPKEADYTCRVTS